MDLQVQFYRRLVSESKEQELNTYLSKSLIYFTYKLHRIKEAAD